MPDSLPPDFAAALRSSQSRRGRFGHPVHYFTRTDSTNRVAAALAEQGAPEGTMVIAAAQTSGRGRLGRRWHSPPDAGLYLSIVCRSPRAAPYLTLAGGVAVAVAVRRETALPVEIKWPNDVVLATRGAFVRRRKLAGILAEASSTARELQHVVLGIGVNLRPAAYPPAIEDRATSIEAELGRPVEAASLLAAILSALAAEYEALSAGDSSQLLRRWRALAPSACGARVEWHSPAGRRTGATAGIADDGALLVETGGTVERIVSGEIVWR